MPEDLRTLFDKADEKVRPLLGADCLLSVEHEIIRYGSGVVKDRWSVSATTLNSRVWTIGADFDTFEASLDDLLLQLSEKKG